MKSDLIHTTRITQLLGVIVCVGLFGCKSNVALLFKSSDMKKTMDDASYVKSIRHTFLSDSMIITYKDKSKKAIACDSLRGIKYKDGTAYRYYKDQYFLLRQDLNIQVYSQTSSGYKSSHTSYYFSKNLDGDIYSLKWKNIRKQFQSDTCFLRKLEHDLKWYQDYSSYDKRNKTYRIISFYKDCKNG